MGAGIARLLAKSAHPRGTGGDRPRGACA